MRLDKEPDFNLFDNSLYVSDSEWTRWKCYKNGKFIKGDTRSFGDHLEAKPKLIYLLIHPETYYENILINDSFRKGSKSKSKINLNDIQSIISKGLLIKNQKNLNFINGVTTIDKPFRIELFSLKKFLNVQKKSLIE